MSDASAPGAAPKDPAQRPLWQWILRALSPSLFYVGFASLSFLVRPIADLSVLVGLIVPAFILVVLFRVADEFFTARSEGRLAPRAVFVFGLGIVNAMIWFGGCGITAHNLDSMLPEKGRSRPPLDPEGEEPSPVNPTRWPQ